LAKAKKQAEAAKSTISDWLEKQRKVTVATLPVGEMVMLEGVCLIEISKQSKFDEKTFMSLHVELHASFKKDFPVVKYKPTA
jgi:hypothetical protein